MAVKKGLLRAARSILQGRSELSRMAGLTYNGKRDLYTLLGYKRALKFADYYDRYRRGGVAGRLVDVYPQATWRQQPVIHDLDKQLNDDRSPFVIAFAEMAERIRLYHYLERADKLAGIGKYSVVLIGAKGNSNSRSALAQNFLIR